MDHNPLDDVRMSDLTEQGSETQVSGREAVSDPNKRDVLDHVDPVLRRRDNSDLGAIAYGIDRIERARKTIYRRQHTDRPGSDWTPREPGTAHPYIVGTTAKAVLGYSDDGARFQVNGYTYDGHHIYRREFASLDAALRNGARVANDGPTPAERADAWNLTYPEGQPVRYWTGAREGAGETGRTRSSAWVAEGHTAVVQVTGHGAWIALTHVEPIRETEG